MRQSDGHTKTFRNALHRPHRLFLAVQPDPSGRLFVASEDPVPLNVDQALAQMQADLKYGVVTINEVRQERGLFFGAEQV